MISVPPDILYVKSSPSTSSPDNVREVELSSAKFTPTQIIFSGFNIGIFKVNYS